MSSLTQQAALSVDSAARHPSVADRERLVRRARVLSWLSLAWMTVEGAVAIGAAVAAGSVALLGFGLDSVVEGLSATIVLWLAARRFSQDAERHAQKLVAISFFVLAPYIAYDALSTLISAGHPSISWVGIGLSVSSLAVMPLLARAKRRVGAQLGSGALASEGSQADLCAYMAAAVLLGLVARALFGLWWLDPVLALGIAVLAVHEGRESWQGEGCACATAPRTRLRRPRGLRGHPSSTRPPSATGQSRLRRAAHRTP